MSKAPFKLALALGLAAAIGSGCDCSGPRVRKQPGEIGIVHEVDGATLTSREAVYDFGSVFMGQKAPLKLVIKNLGNGALGLEKLEKESGAAVSLGTTTQEPDPVFEVLFESRDIGAGDVAEFDMTFLAPQHETASVMDHEVKLILRTSNAAPGEETATLTLKGKAVSGVCELPKLIDFGSVAKGDSYKSSIEIRNPSQLEATANISDLYSTSGDHLAFAFSADSARGTVSLAPGTQKTVSLVFTPTEIKSYLAFVKMQASAQCPQFPVSLKGQGVDSVLTWAPNPLDFGYVPPGTLVTNQLTFTNAGKAEVNLSQIKSLLGDFKVVQEGAADPTKLTVPGSGGETKLLLSFKPAVLGPRTTQLTFQTSLARQPSGAAGLKGYGGGPQIQVIPSPTLAFGKLAYFENASPPSFQSRKLTVMNIGTKPAVADPKANLLLGKSGAGQPYWEVRALNGGTVASELSIAVPNTTGPNSYDPAKGLEASAGKNLVDLVVKLTPASVALKEFEVTVFSNDPTRPETKITVTADVVRLPPCNYQVTPTALNYGLVTPPSYRDLAFSVKNLGQNPGEVCLMSNVDLLSGSDPIFTLPGGQVSTQELQPGEAVQVLVRAWPQGQVPSGVTNATGQVQLFMSSPTQPQKLVALQASIAAGCLTIAPDDLDFGTVQKDCNSATKTFSIYNTCSATVKINSFAMQAAAGQLPGGPNCPGPTACPEFLLVSTPLIPVGGLSVAPGGAPTTFTAKYKPIDMGADSGAIAINALQNGQNVTYMVTLQGKGDTVGLNTDVFTQDAKPKADILLVIDDSCSMSDEQQALATNFTSFIKYAIAAAVDYHIAVTTTDNGSSGAKGKILGDASNPKVLTPATTDVETKFKNKVNLGINGSGLEEMAAPALQALTAPLITAENAGFLRNDAALAVVAVTDAQDQSPQPVTFYYNALMNVKGVKRANLFTYNVIGPFNANPGSGCSYDGNSDDGRHAYLVTQTNGVKEEICSPDWAKSLEQLGKTAFGFRTNFFLNGTPDLTGGKAIVVKIDGVALPNVDARGSTVWTYDPVANSVNFEPMFVPEPGQTLTITYYVTCF